jgi:hypothetical protein
MIVLLIGDTSGGRDNFYNFAIKRALNIIWINNQKNFLYHNNLIVYFGGEAYIPAEMKSITWSGDNEETLKRIYKTLGMICNNDRS